MVKKNGFTLVEVTVILVILAILSLINFFVGPIYLKRARDAKRKHELEIIKTAIYDYYSDNNCFPKALPQCGLSLKADSEVYLANFPCDYNKKPYGYQTDGKDCPQWFKILTNLEDTKDKSIEKVGCQKGCGPNCEYNYGLSSTNIKVNDGCVKYYACTPSGYCVEFIDPDASRCPIVFENDPTCNKDQACKNRKLRCHDERGKKN